MKVISLNSHISHIYGGEVTSLELGKKIKLKKIQTTNHLIASPLMRSKVPIFITAQTVMRSTETLYRIMMNILGCVYICEITLATWTRSALSIMFKQ